MADKITWNDKVSLVTDPTIAEINKVTDSNMNEIKSVTNTNADELTEKIVYDEDDITENTGLIIEEVPEGSNIPYINSEIAIGSTNEDNRPTWFKKGKNLFGNYGTLNGVFINGTANKTDSNANATSVYIQIEPSTTYTISKTKGNRFAIGFAETLPNNNTTLTGIEDDRTATSLTSTSASNSHFLVIYISLSDSETFANIVATIQVEKGSTATTYEPYIAPSIIADNTEFYSQDNYEQYSLGEIRIGTWLGKPLYRKVIDFGALPNNTEKQVTTGLTSSVIITKVYGISNYSQNNATYTPIPYVDPADLTKSMNLIVRDYGTKVGIKTKMDYSAFSAKVILEYTKTTD